MRITKLHLLSACLLLCLVSLPGSPLAADDGDDGPSLADPFVMPEDEGASSDLPQATGTVFRDDNGNGQRDEGEPGLAGVAVSNQVEVVQTDAEGWWSLPVRDTTVFFVVKPRGYRVPVNENNTPQFFYVHRSEAQPALEYPSLTAPTGDLPASIDFPLIPQEEADTVKMLVFGDPQPRNLREVGYIARDVVEPLAADPRGAVLGVTLGDIVFNDLRLHNPVAQVEGRIGVPFYQVIGNHDHNQDVPDDTRAEESFIRHFGPNYYSFDLGPVHFVALDNVHWQGEEARSDYRGHIGEEQLAWLEADLACVPTDRRVVLMMHIPLPGVVPNDSTDDRHALLQLLERFPHTLSLSAHRHFQRHYLIGERDHHHLVCGTVCGSWWNGERDERGIPHATMMCGAPNGHLEITFEGAEDYTIDFVPAGRPRDYQMAIHAPTFALAGSDDELEVVVNVFNGSERSTVRMRLEGPGEGVVGEWMDLEHDVRLDPRYADLCQEQGMPRALPSSHIWAGRLPDDLTPGAHTLRVETTDMHGRTFTATHVLVAIDR